MPKEKADQKSLEKALEFLHHDPQGKRILRVEHTLTLMQAGRASQVPKLLFDTFYDLKKLAEQTHGPLSKTQNAGEQAIARVEFHDCSLKFSLYHSGLLDAHSLIMPLLSGQIIAATYAALGVDMSGFFTQIPPFEEGGD